MDKAERYINDYTRNCSNEQEVDLEKEFDKYTQPITAQDIKDEPFTQLFACAQHFYELGMRVNNPITAADRGTAFKAFKQLPAAGGGKLYAPAKPYIQKHAPCISGHLLPDL